MLDLSNLSPAPAKKQQVKKGPKPKKVEIRAINVLDIPKKNTREGEPGIKIPITDYSIVGQWCDVCETETMHFLDKLPQKIMCNECGTVEKLKGTTKDTIQRISKAVLVPAIRIPPAPNDVKITIMNLLLK
jgi:hypothetical protein